MNPAYLISAYLFGISSGLYIALLIDQRTRK